MVRTHAGSAGGLVRCLNFTPCAVGRERTAARALIGLPDAGEFFAAVRVGDFVPGAAGFSAGVVLGLGVVMPGGFMAGGAVWPDLLGGVPVSGARVPCPSAGFGARPGMGGVGRLAGVP